MIRILVQKGVAIRQCPICAGRRKNYELLLSTPILPPMRPSMERWHNITVLIRQEGCFTAALTVESTAYKETVWNFSEARGENSIDGLELHGWGAWPDPASWNDVIPLQKAAELKQLLATVPKDTPVISNVDNANKNLYSWRNDCI